MTFASMAKDNERRAAHHMYVREGFTAKDIAEKLGLSQNTVGAWVNKYGWKQERTNRQIGPEKERKTILEILEGLSEERLDLQKIPRDDRSEEDLDRISRITDEIAKLNKRLETIAREDGKISLETRMRCMDHLFNRMRERDPELYLKTIDFQEDYLHEIVRDFG